MTYLVAAFDLGVADSSDGILRIVLRNGSPLNSVVAGSNNGATGLSVVMSPIARLPAIFKGRARPSKARLQQPGIKEARTCLSFDNLPKSYVS